MTSRGQSRVSLSICLFAILGVLVSKDCCIAQGTFVQLDTSVGQPLITESVEFSFADEVINPTLRMKVGFATDEIFQPDRFFDSLTITLQDFDATTTLVLATFDASGVLWAPPTPGTTPLSAGSISSMAIAYPSLVPVLSEQQAFEFEVMLPQEIVGRPFTAYFDLFNNQDAFESQGFFQNFQVVPEPGAGWLMGVGGLGLLILARFSRDKKLQRIAEIRK